MNDFDFVPYLHKGSQEVLRYKYIWIYVIYD